MSDVAHFTAGDRHQTTTSLYVERINDAQSFLICFSRRPRRLPCNALQTWLVGRDGRQGEVSGDWRGWW